MSGILAYGDGDGGYYSSRQAPRKVGVNTYTKRFKDFSKNMKKIVPNATTSQLKKIFDTEEKHPGQHGMNYFKKHQKTKPKTKSEGTKLTKKWMEGASIREIHSRWIKLASTKKLKHKSITSVGFIHFMQKKGFNTEELERIRKKRGKGIYAGEDGGEYGGEYGGEDGGEDGGVFIRGRTRTGVRRQPRRQPRRQQGGYLDY